MLLQKGRLACAKSVLKHWLYIEFFGICVYYIGWQHFFARYLFRKEVRNDSNEVRFYS